MPSGQDTRAALPGMRIFLADLNEKFLKVFLAFWTAALGQAGEGCALLL